VFQNYSLFPHMTVAENVGFSLKMRGTSREEIDRQVRAMLDLVQLAGFGDRFLRQISGGQQQRVALARSLIVNPAVLLLDEPLGALDRALREAMQFELSSIQRRLGITTLIVTHDQEEALTMSDRIALMREGELVQYGPPDELYDRPRTQFVAEFLGTANVLGARSEGPAGQHCYRLAIDLGSDRTVSLVPSLGRDIASSEVKVAIRPERVAINPASGSRARGTVAGHVFRGNHHAYQVAVAGLSVPLSIHLPAGQDAGGPIPKVGDEIAIGWNDAHVVLLED
jgi:ABC-type Fe3+/spermidine/putrescine transport system ATPase subunit